MKVVVGSKNPDKIKIVKDALEELHLDVEVVGVPADSGIANQPFDKKTTKKIEHDASESEIQDELDEEELLQLLELDLQDEELELDELDLLELELDLLELELEEQEQELLELELDLQDELLEELLQEEELLKLKEKYS